MRQYSVLTTVSLSDEAFAKILQADHKNSIVKLVSIILHCSREDPTYPSTNIKLQHAREIAHQMVRNGEVVMPMASDLRDLKDRDLRHRVTLSKAIRQNRISYGTQPDMTAAQSLQMAELYIKDGRVKLVEQATA